MATEELKEKAQQYDSYLTQLIMKRDKEGIKKFNRYAKDHAARLRRLEREANGEQVPGDYDGGY